MNRSRCCGHTARCRDPECCRTGLPRIPGCAGAMVRGWKRCRKWNKYCMLTDCVGQDIRRLKILYGGCCFGGCFIHGYDRLISHLFLLKFRGNVGSEGLDAGDHCLLLSQDHSFLVALRNTKASDSDFFFQKKVTFDDDGLFHH